MKKPRRRGGPSVEVDVESEIKSIKSIITRLDITELQKQAMIYPIYRRLVGMRTQNRGRKGGQGNSANLKLDLVNPHSDLVKVARDSENLKLDFVNAATELGTLRVIEFVSKFANISYTDLRKLTKLEKRDPSIVEWLADGTLTSLEGAGIQTATKAPVTKPVPQLPRAVTAIDDDRNLVILATFGEKRYEDLTPLQKEKVDKMTEDYKNKKAKKK